MATVTQTLNGQINGISISSDGKVYATLEWADTSAPTPPSPNPNPKAPLIPVLRRVMGRTMIRIEGDKIYVNNVKDAIADAPAGTATAASSLALSIKNSIDAAISVGKLKP